MEPVVTLVDTNVILDMLLPDPIWEGWSRDQLIAATAAGSVAINHHIYAELGPYFRSERDLDDAVADFLRLPYPWSAAFLASHAFLSYHQNGGSRDSLLPDFYIGAHAAVAGLRLVTRDATRYRTYFPTIELIAPS